MTIADFLILLSFFLPYITVEYAKNLAKGTFNNAKPRDASAYHGAAARAHSAHQNGFEAAPLFAIAVLFAELHGMPQSLVNTLAILYVLVRIAYILSYVNDKASLRSGLFSTGLFVTVLIFLLPVFVVAQ
jgi:uncharacterized MAPEG superfamily protein